MHPRACSLIAFLFVAWPAVEQQPDTGVADSLYRAEDWQGAAAAYEELLDEDPVQAQAWFRLGTARYRLERFEEAIQAWREAEQRGFFPPVVRYNIAAAYGRLNQPDEALAWLRRAAEAGFSNLNGLDEDPDFDALRDDPRFAAVREQVDRNARPCAYSDAHRAFDFWVGEWDVHNAEGRFVGTNSIQKGEAGCVLVERWSGVRGGTGMSINYYDPEHDRWVQHWVAAAGYIVDIEGGLTDDGAMRLVGRITTFEGETNPFRGTWTPLPDGRVRQFFEQSNDGGTTWSPWFDGYYTRRQ